MSFQSSSSRSLSEGPEWNLGKIFGREEESQILLEISEASQSIQSTVILHGPAGSGKSSLIRSQPWKETGWLLASGKFEQHRITGEPFSALTEALNDLVDMWILQNNVAEVCQLGGFRHLLEEDYEFMRNILPKVYQAVMSGPCSASKGSNTKKITKTMLSSSVAMKQDMGTANFVNASFVRILQFLCKTQKVVLFIDDIHWADKASLEVIKVLISGSAGKVDNLLTVLSYRDEEVTDVHPTILTLNAANAVVGPEEVEGVRIHDMPVRDLNVESVNRLVSAVTGHDREETLALAEVVHKKTAGNPFFVTQFLLMLRRESFLTYSFSTFRWEWGDIAKLSNAARVSANVADVIANSLQSLPASTQIAVKVASCLGKIVPLDVLVEYFEGYEESQNGQTCSLGLHQIKESGLHNVLESAVKSGILIKPVSQGAYMWAHDKLQHVAYSLIGEAYRGPLHIKMGKLLWRMSLTDSGEEWMVFLAADQLNRFSDNQQDQVLGAEAASLCLEAAKLSLSKSALFPAYDMLQAGVKYLNVEGRWTAHYDLSLQLYSAVAKVAFELGEKEEAMDAVTEVQEHAKTLEDRFYVQCVLLGCITTGKDRNYAAGAQKALEILKEYGIKFPSKLLPGQMFIENQKLLRKLPGGNLSAFLDLPEMTDNKSLHIMRLLVEYLEFFITMSHRDKQKRCYYVVRALNYSAEHGICEHTCSAIVEWASQLRENGHFKEADEYAEMGLKMNERFPRSVGSLHSRVIGLATAGVFSATRPLNKCLDLWLDAHHVALRTGNTETAAGCILAYSFSYLAVGLPLGSLKSDLTLYEKESRQFRMPDTVAANFRIFQQFIVNLQEDVQRPAVLKGNAMDEDQLLGALDGNGHRMTMRDIYSFRLLLACIYGYWDMAEMLLESLEPFLDNDHHLVRASLRRTSMALAAFRLARTKGKKKHRTMGKKIMKDLEKDLRHGNVNAHPLYLMLQAEESPSKEKYDQGIRACARLGLIHYEAYLCERAGEFFLEQKDDGWSEYYMGQAFVLWEDWGARGKANKMKEVHPELLKSSNLREKAKSALKGRTRYSSEHADMLKDFTWERLISVSTSSLKVTAGSDTSTDFSSGTGSERNRGVMANGIFTMVDPTN